MHNESFTITEPPKVQEIIKKKLELVVDTAKTNVRGWEKKVSRRYS